jgi:hypothetical protein
MGLILEKARLEFAFPRLGLGKISRVLTETYQIDFLLFRENCCGAFEPNHTFDSPDNPSPHKLHHLFAD